MNASELMPSEAYFSTVSLSSVTVSAKQVSSSHTPTLASFSPMAITGESLALSSAAAQRTAISNEVARRDFSAEISLTARQGCVKSGAASSSISYCLTAENTAAKILRTAFLSAPA